MNRTEFAAALRGLSGKYWDSHRFHARLHAGGCTEAEVRSWVANRWYYQRTLSQKNAAIMANCPLPDVRARWVKRILFQDRGGLEDWLILGEAVGLSRDEVVGEEHVLRGVRFAVDGYLRFCTTRPWHEGAAAALTELFSPDLMAARIVAWQAHYDWIKPDGFAYFQSRIPVVQADSRYTLDLVLNHCVTGEMQQAAIDALAFKCDVLGAILDAIDYAAMTS